MASETSKPRLKGRYAYDGLDRVLHEKARLSVLTSLASHPEGILFAELRDLCRLTDGNLSRHLQILRDETVVDVEKSFRDGKPQTMCRLTEHGRERFLTYLDELERVLRDASTSRRTAPRINSPKTV
ncbi:MAG: transcriptional regulator [Pseudomonadota bacterium]